MVFKTFTIITIIRFKLFLIFITYYMYLCNYLLKILYSCKLNELYPRGLALIDEIKLLAY